VSRKKWKEWHELKSRGRSGQVEEGRGMGSERLSQKSKESLESRESEGQRRSRKVGANGETLRKKPSEYRNELSPEPTQYEFLAIRIGVASESPSRCRCRCRRESMKEGKRGPRKTGGFGVIF
jgi:hypothetical protein